MMEIAAPVRCIVSFFPLPSCRGEERREKEEEIGRWGEEKREKEERTASISFFLPV